MVGKQAGSRADGRSIYFAGDPTLARWGCLTVDSERRVTTGPLTPPRRGRPPKPENGDNSGTAPLQVVESIAKNHSALAYQAVAPIPPRVFDLPNAARYLGVSERLVWGWAKSGRLRRVRYFDENGKELRKLVFDKADLDRLVDLSKDDGNG